MSGGVSRPAARAASGVPSGPIGLRRSILINLANASFYLGRLDETIATLEHHRALRQEDGSTVDAATVAFNLLNARLTQQEQRPGRVHETGSSARRPTCSPRWNASGARHSWRRRTASWPT